MNKAHAAHRVESMDDHLFLLHLRPAWDNDRIWQMHKSKSDLLKSADLASFLWMERKWSAVQDLNLCWKVLQYSPCDAVETNTYVLSVKSREVATIHESYIIIVYTGEKEALKGLFHWFAAALVWEQNLSDLNYT